MRGNGEVDAVIIGAGLAGLACARGLQAAGRSFSICESADRVGGRVATDVVEGCLLGTTGPPVASHGVGCLYFTSSVAPVDEPILLLDGEGTGPVNNLTVLSEDAP